MTLEPRWLADPDGRWHRLQLVDEPGGDLWKSFTACGLALTPGRPQSMPPDGALVCEECATVRGA